MHAVDKRLTFVALAATYIQFAVLSHHLCAWQGLKCRHDVAARVARHNHVERVHRLEVVALAEAVGAGRYYHLVDGCRLLVHLNHQACGLTGGHRVVFKSDERYPYRHLVCLAGMKREVSERVCQTSVNRTYYKYVGSGERFTSVGYDARYCCGKQQSI